MQYVQKNKYRDDGGTDITVIGACSLFGKQEEPRNGMVVIGEEQPLKEFAEQNKTIIQTQEMFKIKTSDLNGKKALIMDKTTAEAIVKQGGIL
ncbi:lipoprotein BA_5634 family protein [Paenibacillus sp. FJAT-26967]|uniref:lipoprotein BA_5634 family protein n=1 Tax=Paenibacillus sp. FJAT-26967 TaxID=1729690 RepID=UPI000A0737BA|nr:lipoprotein BA_5634 family protein [Paenibacillus sp. FJAT-26967]